MTTKKGHWTKEELQVYVLMLCAHADGIEKEEEITVIKSKTDSKTFAKIHAEFLNDTDERRLEKIDENVHQHVFTQMQLGEFRREIYEVFFADCQFQRMEKNLDRILDNLLY